MSKGRAIRVGLVALPLFLLASVVWAGSSPQYGLDWQVLSGGGAPAESSSGLVAMNGTLGQTAIGPSDGDVSIGAGFWYGLAREEGYWIYLPLVLRNY